VVRDVDVAARRGLEIEVEERRRRSDAEGRRDLPGELVAEDLVAVDTDLADDGRVVNGFAIAGLAVAAGRGADGLHGHGARVEGAGLLRHEADHGVAGGDALAGEPAGQAHSDGAPPSGGQFRAGDGDGGHGGRLSYESVRAGRVPGWPLARRSSSVPRQSASRSEPSGGASGVQAVPPGVTTRSQKARRCAMSTGIW